MTLDEYRKSKRLSLAALAAQLGASHATVVRRWCLPLEHPQSMIPSPAFMTRIMEVTGGAVQPNDFYRAARYD
jgi:transcriptional regulator with XRE-family HTH domain